MSVSKIAAGLKRGDALREDETEREWLTRTAFKRHTPADEAYIAWIRENDPWSRLGAKPTVEEFDKDLVKRIAEKLVRKEEDLARRSMRAIWPREGPEFDPNPGAFTEETLKAIEAKVREKIINEPERIRKDNEMAKRATGTAAAAVAAKAQGDSIMVAAAKKAAEEIKSAVSDWDNPPGVTMNVVLPTYLFNVMTKANWRKIALPYGHELTWKGAVRPSAKGKLLFILHPEMNSELENREATYAELPHDELDAAVGPGFLEWFSDAMGVNSVEELLFQARTAVDPDDLAKADEETRRRIEAEQKALEEEKTRKMEADPVFGSWA